MDAKYYCDAMQDELTSTRARLYTIIRDMERIAPEDREVAASGIAEMNRLVDDIGARIDRLRTECPVDWVPQKEEIESMRHRLMEKVDMWDAEHIAGGYVGG